MFRHFPRPFEFEIFLSDPRIRGSVTVFYQPNCGSPCFCVPPHVHVFVFHLMSTFMCSASCPCLYVLPHVHVYVFRLMSMFLCSASCPCLRVPPHIHVDVFRLVSRSLLLQLMSFRRAIPRFLFLICKCFFNSLVLIQSVVSFFGIQQTISQIIP